MCASQRTVLNPVPFSCPRLVEQQTRRAQTALPPGVQVQLLRRGPLTEPDDAGRNAHASRSLADAAHAACKADR